MFDALETFLATEKPAILVEIAGAKGSTPREKDAWMLVSKKAQIGTIGGGQLEYLAIDHARMLLAEKKHALKLDIPLGPEIGQCCGGRVEIVFTPVDSAVAENLTARLKADDAENPHVYIFGAGHTGKALAAALAPLPLHTIAVETRAHELNGLAAGVETICVAMPEAMVANIPPHSAVVILTHDHALDFLIAAEALKRGDLAYVGMIGSATKRATFAKWLQREGGKPSALNRLTTPIGGKTKDKRPAVIAALTTAEILVKLANGKSTKATNSERKTKK
ncbi:xanthine dehydrogenase accessory protein XdhC [Rhizobium sp. L1K21]|uniref:xanthine dehydrogenase accessory protein XdhC n=1 Tax=Rhizobium sp. L1K21 TaxID=2954933 RepID=UPI002093097A|nr:xanthine dehydrogenase accessory protein XdhC [Rhizobium sp. L1K21]MCO6185129.1 xanthine dehydrogenase accessory protein XdhC [Rhizobium sp. L1K21]